MWKDPPTDVCHQHTGRKENFFGGVVGGISDLGEEGLDLAGEILGGIVEVAISALSD